MRASEDTGTGGTPPPPTLLAGSSLALLCRIWVMGKGGSARVLHIRELMQRTEGQRGNVWGMAVGQAGDCQVAMGVWKGTKRDGALEFPRGKQ